LKTLLPGKWIVSCVINYIGQLLNEKHPNIAYLFTDYFSMAEDFTQKNNYISRHITNPNLQAVIWPLHFPGHWTLALIILGSKKIYFFDSMPDNVRFVKFKSFVEQLSFLNGFEVSQKHIWKQDDSHSCGIAVISKMIDFSSSLDVEKCTINSQNKFEKRKEILDLILHDSEFTTLFFENEHYEDRRTYFINRQNPASTVDLSKESEDSNESENSSTKKKLPSQR